MATTLAEQKEVMRAMGTDPDQSLTQQGVDFLDHPAFAGTAKKQCGVKMSAADSLSLKPLNNFVRYLNAKA